MSRCVGKRSFVILLFLTMLAILLPVSLTDNVRAAEDDQYLYGLVFTSDGNVIPSDTDFRVWVLHDGTWHRFPSNATWHVIGTREGWYSLNLTRFEKEVNWTNGDFYRVQVDCSPWGDLVENATSNGTGSAGDPISPRGSYDNTVNWKPGGFDNNQRWDVVCSNHDLAPSDIKVNDIPYSPPFAVSPLSTVKFSSNVTNMGQPMISEPNTIVLRDESGVLGQDTATTIDAGGSVGPFNFTWDAPAGGYFCFNITVDYYDNVTETDENNNSEMVCFSVGEADLTPSGVGVTTNYGTEFYADVSLTGYRSNLMQITPGTQSIIVANVTNVGTLSSGQCTLALYNTTGEGGPIIGIPFFQSTVNPLNPGAVDGPFVAIWTAPAIPGDYYMNITADYYDDVVEIDPLNNTFVVRFLVGYPDYIPLNDTIPDPWDVTGGAPIPIDMVVENVGPLDALVVSAIAFYNQSTPLTPFQVYADVPTIGAGNQAGPYGATWIAPVVTTLTSYFVVTEVDYNDDVAEGDELNNTLVIEFRVFPGPITTLVYGDPHHVAGPDLWITSSTQLDFSVVFAADWACTHYYLDDVGPTNYSQEGQFTIPDEGVHYLNFSSFDNLGNVEPLNTRVVTVDDSSPITTLNVFGLKSQLGATLYVRSSSDLSIIHLNWTRDDEPEPAVGRKETPYRVFKLDDGWSGWTNFTVGNPIELDAGDGLRFVEYHSIDLLDNSETVHNATLWVDDTPPETELDIGEPKHDRSGTLCVEASTDFTLSATDEGSGTDRMEYRVDEDTTWLRYTEPFKVDKPGRHTIYFRGTDNLENVEDPQSQEIFVLESNQKPLMAIILIVVMVVAGAFVGYRKPLLMARRKRGAKEDLPEEQESEDVAISEGEHSEKEKEDVTDLKDLASDRRMTAVIAFLPFAVVEAVIALLSWMIHPSDLSVPDLDNWISAGLIVNVVVIALALASMCLLAWKGEGAETPKAEED